MKKHLKESSIDIKKHSCKFQRVWMFEEGDGLYIYGENYEGMSNRLAVIPLATIRAYLRRLDKEADNG